MPLKEKPKHLLDLEEELAQKGLLDIIYGIRQRIEKLESFLPPELSEEGYTSIGDAIQHSEPWKKREKPKDSLFPSSTSTKEERLPQCENCDLQLSESEAEHWEMRYDQASKEIEKLKEANAALASLVQNQKNIAGLEEKNECLSDENNRLKSEVERKAGCAFITADQSEYFCDYDREMQQTKKIIEKALEGIYFTPAKSMYLIKPWKMKEILEGKS